jgi:hypothetical protein
LALKLLLTLRQSMVGDQHVLERVSRTAEIGASSVQIADEV